MKIDHEKLKEFFDRLDIKECPICGKFNNSRDFNELKGDWGANDEVFLLPMLGKAGAYPVIAIYCTRCGFTCFVNAVVAGLITKEQATEELDKDARKQAISGMFGFVPFSGDLLK